MLALADDIASGEWNVVSIKLFGHRHVNGCGWVVLVALLLLSTEGEMLSGVRQKPPETQITFTARPWSTTTARWTGRGGRSIIQLKFRNKTSDETCSGAVAC